MDVSQINLLKYCSRNISWSEMYLSFFAQKRNLERQHFRCDWRFGSDYGTILTPRMINPKSNVMPLAILERDEIEFHLVFNPRKESLFVYGEKHVYGQQKIYENVLSTLNDVYGIIGLEMIVIAE